MTTEILVNREHPISKVGKRFSISPKNNINGNIIFSEKSGNLKAYTLNKYQYKNFDISDMIKNKHILFEPEFVEFRTDDIIEEISINILPVIS